MSLEVETGAPPQIHKGCSTEISSQNCSPEGRDMNLSRRIVHFQSEIETLKKELERAQEQYRHLTRANKQQEKKQKTLEKRITQEVLARAQDGFSSKSKIDTLMIEVSRLRAAINGVQGKSLAKCNKAEYGSREGLYRSQEERRLTFHQRKVLCDAIPKLDDAMLDKVIRIISETLRGGVALGSMSGP
ncbi:hypothetical protein C8R44DRAFT_735282 [Mycena epipterygia]|nr:hypothetical protein C8R44DRAFT_735282 [Mycena epipterygia]